MGFIFGLIVGGALMSGGDTAVSRALGAIPFRCLAALDVSEADYQECRTPSLRVELYGQNTSGICVSPTSTACRLDKHLAWEIAGLREMKKAIEQRQAANR